MTLDLKKLRELEAAATKGEWKSDQGTFFIGAYFPQGGACSVCEVAKDADAEFIAAARNAMPKLLDWIERAKGHVELSVLSTFCGKESPCLCPRCDAIDLLARIDKACSVEQADAALELPIPGEAMKEG